MFPVSPRDDLLHVVFSNSKSSLRRFIVAVVKIVSRVAPEFPECLSARFVPSVQVQSSRWFSEGLQCQCELSHTPCFDITS